MKKMNKISLYVSSRWKRRGDYGSPISMYRGRLNLDDDQMISFLISCSDRLSRYIDDDCVNNYPDDQYEFWEFNKKYPAITDLQGYYQDTLYISDKEFILWEKVKEIATTNYDDGSETTVGSIIEERLGEICNEVEMCEVQPEYFNSRLSDVLGTVDWFMSTDDIIRLSAVEEKIVPLLVLIGQHKKEAEERVNAC